MKRNLKVDWMLTVFLLALTALACQLLPSVATDREQPLSITETTIRANPTVAPSTSVAIASTATTAPSARATENAATRQPTAASSSTPTRAVSAATTVPTATSTARPTNTATLTVESGCPAPSLPTAKPSGLIKSVTTAQNYDQKLDTIVGPSTEFKANSEVHVVIAVQNAPANTTVKTKWYANDVGKAAPCNTMIGEPELTLDTGGSGNLDFKQGPIIPTGSYRIEIYVNAVFDRAVSFSVK